MRPVLACVSLLLGACSPPPEPPADRSRDNLIGAPLEQSLDRARAVEEVGAGRKDSLDQALDDAD